MRKLILTTLFFLCAIVVHSQEQDFNHVWISKQKVNLKPAVIYVNYGNDFYLTFRDGKRVFDYKLNLLGSKMMGGFIEYNFKAFNEQNKEIKGLRISITTGDGGVRKQSPATLIFTVNEVDSGSFDLVAL